MKKRGLIIGIIVLFSLVLILFVLNPTREQGAQSKRVGVLLFAQHKIIDEIWRGFQDHLNSIADGNNYQVNYVIKNADGQQSQAGAIASSFRGEGFDVIFVVGIPAAQALKAASISVPVVFGGPPDAVAAGLVSSIKHHGSNFTGTQYLPDSDVILKVFRMIHPNAKECTILYNPGESNSVALVNRMVEKAPDSLEINRLGASTTSELEATLREIRRSPPSGIFIPTDNFIYSVLDRVIATANDVGIPVFSVTRFSVEKGAEFAVGADYYRVGELSADIAAKILFEGKAPADLDVYEVAEGIVFINKRLIQSSKNLTPPTGYRIEFVPD